MFVANVSYDATASLVTTVDDPAQFFVFLRERVRFVNKQRGGVPFDHSKQSRGRHIVRSQRPRDELFSDFDDLLNPPPGANIRVNGGGVQFAANTPVIGSMAALSASGVRSGSSNGGFIGGGQIGYNWQFYNSFVAGVEADIQGIASNNSAVAAIGAGADPTGLWAKYSPVATILQIRRSVDYLGTVRGRLGWLFTPTLLVYGTGGLAYGGVNHSANFLTANLGPGDGSIWCGSCVFGPSFGGGSYSNTRVGWTAGGGLEWMFWPNWSAKAEYLYYDLGNVTTSPAVLVGASNAGSVDYAYVASAKTRFNGHIVRAGVNYHFNFGAAPIIAKY